MAWAGEKDGLLRPVWANTDRLRGILMEAPSRASGIGHDGLGWHLRLVRVSSARVLFFLPDWSCYSRS